MRERYTTLGPGDFGPPDEPTHIRIEDHDEEVARLRERIADLRDLLAEGRDIVAHATRGEEGWLDAVVAALEVSDA